MKKTCPLCDGPAQVLRLEAGGALAAQAWWCEPCGAGASVGDLGGRLLAFLRNGRGADFLREDYGDALFETVLAFRRLLLRQGHISSIQSIREKPPSNGHMVGVRVTW